MQLMMAAATKANIVVNYPNVKVPNPIDPSRGAAVYQALVHLELSPS